jgi:hypothetical protein
MNRKLKRLLKKYLGLRHQMYRKDSFLILMEESILSIFKKDSTNY